MLLPKTLPLTTDDRRSRLVAACSYLGLLLMPALYAAREDDYVAFHANQGLTLLLAPLPFWMLGACHAMAGRATTMPLIGWIRLLRSSIPLRKKKGN